MSTTIKYIKHYTNEELSVYQKDLVDEYSEQIFDDDQIKKVTNYYKGEIEHIVLYVYPEDDLDAILETLPDIGNLYTIAKNYEVIGTYTSWKFFNYKDGMLNSRYRIKVYDSNNRMIALAMYDGDDELTTISVYKTYYLSGKQLLNDDGEVRATYGDDQYIEFELLLDGSMIIDVHFDMMDRYESRTDLEDDWLELFPFMTSEVLDYFTSLAPLVPTIEL